MCEKLMPGAEANKVIKTDNTGDLKGMPGVALEDAAGDAEAIAVFVGGAF